MPSTKKLTKYHSSQFKGPRRAKPKVRHLNQGIRDRITNEKELLERLVRDADARRSLLRAIGKPAPLAVWTDFDQHCLDITEVNLNQLPKWEDIGEFLKLHLLFQVALEFGGYSFTVRVRPDLEAKWDAQGKDPMDRIKRATRKALEEQGLKSLEYAFVLEAHTRRGGSRTPLHLHGFFITDDPLESPRFTVAMEKAIAAHTMGRAAAGIKPKSGRAVKSEPSYDKIDGSPHGRGRWASYIAKNATRWRAGLNRRIYISQPATQAAREFWALIREDPIA